jgi:hypothetical protein
LAEGEREDRDDTGQGDGEHERRGKPAFDDGDEGTRHCTQHDATFLSRSTGSYA